MHLLDVLVTQHAKWTAKRIRRGLFGQALVDFSTPSWSCIQMQESSKCTASQQKRVMPKKTPRLLRTFAQSRIVAEERCTDQRLIPGMSQYSDTADMNVGTTQLTDSPSILTCAANNKELSQGSDIESDVSGCEESIFR